MQPTEGLASKIATSWPLTAAMPVGPAVGTENSFPSAAASALAAAD